MAKERYLEGDIKSLIFNHLINNNLLGKNDTIINEFIIGNYTRRVDLALIKSQKLHAFEIKSEADNLSRLEGQIIKYLEYFDKVTVVAASKHISKILSLAPPNVAIWEIRDKKIIILRRGKAKNITDKLRFLEYLRVSELLQIARQEKLVFQSNRRKTLEKGLIYLPTHKLREYSIKYLKKRYQPTTDLFFQEINKANYASLENLSLLRINRNNKIPNNSTKNINDLLNVLEELEHERELSLL